MDSLISIAFTKMIFLIASDCALHPPSTHITIAFNSVIIGLIMSMPLVKVNKTRITETY